jgi:hypothetical protein
METRYSDEQMALILKRAAELQPTGDEPTLTLGAIQQIAEEIGIDRRLVADAAASLSLNTVAKESSLFGAPSAIRLTRSIPGSLRPVDTGTLIATIRDHTSQAGVVRELSGSIEWHAGAADNKTLVTLTPSVTGTVIRIDGRYHGQKAALYLGAGIVTLIVTVLGIAASREAALGLGLGLGTLVVSFAAARAGWNRLIARRRERIERLTNALVAQLEGP